MKMSSYTSSFLTADDVRKGPKLCHIISLTEEKVGTDTKPILYLDDGNEEIKVALNKTNIDRLIEIFGTDESDEWLGEPIVVFCDPGVMFQNKRVGGIAFRKPKPGANVQKKIVVQPDSDANGVSVDDSPF